MKILDGANQPGFLVSLMASVNDELHPSGSAALISSNIAITASHVIQDFENQFKNGYTLVGVCGHNKKEMAEKRVSVDRVALINSDLALIIFKDPFSKKCSPISITLKPPEIGREITGYGFTESKAAVHYNENGRNIHWGHKSLASTGKVTEVYSQFRDKGLITFPSIRTDAAWPPGMSGGPVINCEGYLIGVISSSIQYSDSNWDSYGALIWPLLNLHSYIGYGIDSNSSTYIPNDKANVTIDEVSRAIPILDGEGELNGTSYGPLR